VTQHKFDPFEHGIYRRFLDSAGYLNSVSWNRAVSGGEHVGTCRNCGDRMLGLPTEIEVKITWYTARCTNGQCERVIAAPNANVLRRSSRHGEMPDGWWAQRTQKAN